MITTRNRQSLVFHLAALLSGADAESEMSNLRSLDGVEVFVNSPEELQSCGPFTTDPFSDFLRAIRVCIPVSPPPVNGVEPEFHVRADRLMAACRQVKVRTPQNLEALRRRNRPAVAIYRHPIAERLEVHAHFPGASTLVDVYSHVLYLGVLRELASKVAEIKGGGLRVTWETIHDTEQVIGTVHGNSHRFHCIYANEQASATPLVGPDPYQWIGEVDVLRDKAIGLRCPVVRHVHVPIIAAHRLLAVEEDRRRFAKARASLDNCRAPEWKEACLYWVDRLEDQNG